MVPRAILFILAGTIIMGLAFLLILLFLIVTVPTMPVPDNSSRRECVVNRLSNETCCPGCMSHFYTRHPDPGQWLAGVLAAPQYGSELTR